MSYRRCSLNDFLLFFRIKSLRWGYIARDNIIQEEKSFANLRCINWCLLKVYPLTLVPDQGIWVTPYFPTHLNQALDLCQSIFLKGHLQYWNMALSDPAWYHAGQKHKDVRLSMFLRFSILSLNTFESKKKWSYKYLRKICNQAQSRSTYFKSKCSL